MRLAKNLNSLTDILKTVLCYFPYLSEEELVGYVRAKMLKELSYKEILEKTRNCLQQNPCFFLNEDGFWAVRKEGLRENDSFFKQILISKKSQKYTFKDKKNKKVQQLSRDSRFVQLDDGSWALTYWVINESDFLLREKVARELMIEELTLEKLAKRLNSCEAKVLNVLKKYPFFEQNQYGFYQINHKLKKAYAQASLKYMDAIRKIKKFYQKEKLKVNSHWLSQAQEALEQAAAAKVMYQKNQEELTELMEKVAEKDFLLALRREELIRLSREKEKLKRKADSILYQCRLWHARYQRVIRDKEELLVIKEKLENSVVNMFQKLNAYREKDKENRQKLFELKNNFGEKVAKLEKEVIEVQEQLKKAEESWQKKEKKLRQDLERYSLDLGFLLNEKESLEKREKELLEEIKEQKQILKHYEELLSKPIIRVLCKLINWWQRITVTS
ncbi:hypothetical protein [Carboxydothermus pertinax]|uniref:Phage-shock protein n=1 Tax=Carboxydothermus pertinax TaxID=870242 RepID=A0A1L8CW26_9THEO|nr:hypothetical protein [Carboxydothermus pertinax]GAV23126.1 hypothetical protein cpu_16360 [Carboxydothermus pertinax]